MTTPGAESVSHTGADVLWRIGDFDRGSDQFSHAWFAAGVEPSPTFRVGSGDPARDWPAVQPGPLNGSTGFRPATCAIVFDVEAVDAPAYELHLRLFGGHGPCPQLEVDCNGHRLLAAVDPVRVDRSGLRIPASPISGWADVRVAIPAGWLRAGENRIALTTVELDMPGADELRPSHPQFGPWFGSLLAHGGVELRRTTAAALQPTVNLQPLPLYRRHGATLVECADLVVTAPHGFRRGHAVVVVGDHREELALDLAGRDAGMVRCRIEVPDAAGIRDAEVTVDLDGVVIRLDTRFVPCRKWTVHVVPHVHLDVGYTDYQGKVFELHARNVDRIVALLRANPDYAFSVDGSFIVRHFLESRTPGASDEALDWMRRGRIGVNGFWLLFLSGIASLEECYRAARFTAGLHEQHGVPMEYANLTDVPSYSSALPSILHDLGIPAFFGMQNHARGGNEDSDVLHLRSPFRWRGPDGAETLAYFADSYSQLRNLAADPPTVPGLASSLTRFLHRYEREDYAATDIPVVGIQADNEDIAHGEAELVERWNATYAYPRLRYSTFADYSRAVLPLRDRLPVVSGDGGSYWEDRAATNAVLMSLYRNAQCSLPNAEALSVLVSTVDERLRPPIERLGAAWEALLATCEHSWSAAHSIARPHADQTADLHAWKFHQVQSADRAARDELRGALSRLAELVDTHGPSLLLWNGLSWPRRDIVECELEPGVAICDDAGTPLAAELVEHVDDLQRVRFDTGEIHAFGCRAFRLTRTAATAQPADSAATEVIDTGRYRIEIDAAGHRIGSLTHLGTGRELVDAHSPWGMGEALYVSGGGGEQHRGMGPERTSLFDNDRTLPAPQLTVHRSVQAYSVHRTPWGWSLRFDGAADPLRSARTELRFHADSDRIDVVVDLDKLPVMAKEAVYVAFPFALSTPRVRYDRQQGWVDPEVDHQPGACNEWLALQHAVVLEETGLAITLAAAEAPMVTVGDVVRGTWARRFQPAGTVLSWVMHNYWFTDCPPTQEGRLRLRYAILPAAEWNPVASARLGRELRTAVAVNQVTWLDKSDGAARPLAAAATSLLPHAWPEGVAVTVHAPRRGRGMALRLQETAGRETDVELPEPFDPGTVALACNALEQEERPLDSGRPRRVSLGPWAVRTVLLRPEEGRP